MGRSRRFNWIVILGLLQGSCTPTPPPLRHPQGAAVVRAGAPWDDPIRCQEVVRAGARMPRAQFRVRVGTWNLHFFPGDPRNPRRQPTDVAWLACVLTWLDADLWALQEVTMSGPAQLALDEVARQLDTLTQGSWKWRADPCPGPERPHVAILYRADRLDLSLFAVHPEIDPTRRREGGTPDCPGVLRPALVAYVQSRVGGLDFHFVTTHLDTGQKPRDFEHRQLAWSKLAELVRVRSTQRPDADFVMAADFSTTGCPACQVASDSDELENLRLALRTLPAPWVVAPADHACSQDGRPRPQLTAHVAHTKAMREARGGRSNVAGLCAAARCRAEGWRSAPAHQRLSTHCPVTFDFVDYDEDGAPPVVAPKGGEAGRDPGSGATP